MPQSRLHAALLVAGCLMAAVALAPLLALAPYAHPAADDFSYAAVMRDIGFWRGQAYVYNTWGGRYTATLLLAALPSLLNGGFAVVPVVCIAALAGAGALAVNVLCRGRSAPVRAVVFGSIMLVAVAGAPSLREAFFWGIGVATYTLGAALALAGYCLLQLRSRRLHIAGTVALVLACGCSEVCAGLTVAATVLHAHRAGWQRWWPVVGIVLLAAAALVVAPGNFVRRSGTPYSGDWLVGTGAGLYALARLAITRAPLLVGLAGILLSLPRNSSGAPLRTGWWKPWAAVMVLGHIGIGWMAGSLPEQRVENVFWIYGLAVIAFRCVRRRAVQSPRRALAVGIVGLIIGFFVLPHGLRTAYADWVSGRGRAFHQASLRQEALALEPGTDSVALPPLQPLPHTLFAAPTFDTLRNPKLQSPTTGYARAWYRKRVLYYARPLALPHKKDDPLTRHLKDLRAKWGRR